MVTHEDLLAQATTQTGLDDFGDDSFREGLEILVRALGDEARLNATGEAFLYPRIVGHLGQRLQVEDWYRRHPEIDDVEITSPLFGLSLPRTGSTALSFLLAQDPDIRFLRQWESSQPCPPPSTVVGHDPRVPEPTEERAASHGHVPTDANGPMECLELMALDCKSQIFLAFARVPSYGDWLIDADLTSTYLYERRVLKLLQWGEPAREWRLKSPAHLLWLDGLDAAFPDARFVMTHRDPTEVLLSVAGVYADVGSAFTDEVDRGYIGELNVRQWSIGMDRTMKFRDEHGDDRFYDIDFRAMQAEPIAEVTGLYAWLSQPVSDEFESGMRRWWAENAENREPSTHPDPRDFGIDLEQIRPMFAEYVTRSRSWTAH